MVTTVTWQPSWSWAPAVSPPALGTGLCPAAPTSQKTHLLGTSQVDWGSRGHAETLLGLQESEVEPSHTRLWLFSKLGIIVLIYGIIKITL